MKEDKLLLKDVPICRYSEVITVENDDYIFEIQRKGETLLLINGEPNAVVWHDNGPSSGHYYAIQGIEKDDAMASRLARFEQLVQDQLSDDTPLLELFDVYQPLLKSGQYRLFYSYPDAYQCGGLNYGSPRSKSFSLCLSTNETITRGGLYLDEGVFLFSQALSTINEDRVKYYETQIENGICPTLICLGMECDQLSITYDQFTDSYPQFIIDGHHKALAYYNVNQRRRKQPTFEYLVPGVFHIVRLQSSMDDFTKVERKNALEKLLQADEVEEIYQFYD